MPRCQSPAWVKSIPIVVAAAVVPLVLPGSSALAIALEPHRATYDVQTVRVSPQSVIASISGRMEWTMDDACEAWSAVQSDRLNFVYRLGSSIESVSIYRIWETKDGDAFNFQSRIDFDGQTDSERKGIAGVGTSGGKARYTVPDQDNVNLPAETLFPVGHLSLIIESAKAGKRFVSALVFDGLEDRGLTETTASIGAEIEPSLEATSDPLLSVRGWSVRLAVFKSDSTDELPIYEMEMTLLENGVTRDLVVDYGDFAFRAALSEIERRPVDCAFASP